MSYASRTHAALYPIKGEVGCVDLVPAEFANELELQNDQLAKQCVKFVEEISELRETQKRQAAVIKSWKEDEGQDARRMEFLLERTEAQFRSLGWRYDVTRESIDKAIKERNLKS